MKKNQVQLFVSSILVVLTILMPQKAHGMEDCSKSRDQNSFQSHSSHTESDSTTSSLGAPLCKLEANEGEGTEQQRIKYRQEDLGKKQEIFAIRGSNTDKYIVQYNLLEHPQSSEELARISKRLIELYQLRTEISYPLNNYDYNAQKIILQSKSTIDFVTGPELKGKNVFEFGWYESIQPLKTTLLCLIKEDVLECMKLYKEINGEPHSRWDKFKT